MEGPNDTRVGYKRPPTHSRFKLGVSGNPGGRPKRRPSFRELLLDELAAPEAADAKEGVSKLRAVIRSLIASAIAGNGRSQALLLDAIVRIGEADDEAELLSPEDRELLESYAGGKSEQSP